MLVEEVEPVQKTNSDDKGARRGVEEKLLMLKSSGTASDELIVRLTESEEALETACAEVSLLKEQGGTRGYREDGL